MRWSVGAAFVGSLFVAGASRGADPTFRCYGERIEKGQSTWGYARPSGDGIRIETTTQSLGFAIDRGSKWAIESFGRSTLGWLSGDRIERPNGETWTNVSTARDFAACRDEVAASLWVLHQQNP